MTLSPLLLCVCCAVIIWVCLSFSLYCGVFNGGESHAKLELGGGGTNLNKITPNQQDKQHLSGCHHNSDKLCEASDPGEKLQAQQKLLK